jgi:ABC-2 type transport system permease protein
MFAISNMPPVVQGITYIVPARYFVELVKGIFLRGSGLETLWLDAIFLLVFSTVATTAAVLRFRKRLD